MIKRRIPYENFFSWQRAVRAVCNEPPPDYGVRERYIAGGQPTGVWEGIPKDSIVIARAGSVWEYYQARKGFVVRVMEADDFMMYDGQDWLYINLMHTKLHDIDDPTDHKPVSGDKKGKLVATNPETGEIELVEKSDVVIPDHDDLQGLNEGEHQHLTQGQVEGLHPKLHDIDNPLDHALVSEEKRNKIIATTEDGGIEFLDKETVGITVHNDLDGLNEADYQHLTQEQVDALHERVHTIDNYLDHAPSSVENRGKYVRANTVSGAVGYDYLGVEDAALKCVHLNAIFFNDIEGIFDSTFDNTFQ